MSFKVSISNYTLEKSVESVSFNVNAPSRELSSPRIYRWDSMIITGKIGFDEDINVLSNWASISAMNNECTKEIIVEETKADQLVRKIRFSKAFVISYSESYTDDTGVGYYSAFIRNMVEQDTEITNEVNTKTIEGLENKNVIEEAAAVVSITQTAVNIEKVVAKKQGLSFTDMLEKQKKMLDDEGVRDAKFQYKHNPSDSPKVLLDAVEDTNAVYGYKPNNTGSLKKFVKYDWSNPDVVAKFRNNRLLYHIENDGYKELVNSMRADGCLDVEIAKTLVKKRNDNRLSSYINEDGKILDIELYNQAKEHCVSYEELKRGINGKSGKSDLQIIESAMKGNEGMDACCGLYDDYYSTYK